MAEALELYSSFYARPRDWRDLAERLGLIEQRNIYFGKLSGGQKQRLSVALAPMGVAFMLIALVGRHIVGR